MFCDGEIVLTVLATSSAQINGNILPLEDI